MLLHPRSSRGALWIANIQRLRPVSICARSLCIAIWECSVSLEKHLHLRLSRHLPQVFESAAQVDSQARREIVSSAAMACGSSSPNSASIRAGCRAITARPPSRPTLGEAQPGSCLADSLVSVPLFATLSSLGPLRSDRDPLPSALRSSCLAGLMLCWARDPSVSMDAFVYLSAMFGLRAFVSSPRKTDIGRVRSSMNFNFSAGPRLPTWQIS